MEPIRSANNPRIKRALLLHASRGRQKQQRIIIFGMSEIQKAFQARIPVAEVFMCREYLDDSIEPSIVRWQSTGARLFELPQKLFEKIAYGDRTDGVVAVADRPNRDWEAFDDTVDARNISLVLVLQSIEKPGNLGAIFRTADAAGVDAVFVADPKTDLFHPNTIRSSLGTVFSKPAVVAGSDQIKNWLRQRKFQVLPAIVDATQSYTRIDLTLKTAIVLGNETSGLNQQWRDVDFQPVKIEMAGTNDSLNVSVTAAVMVFEAMRQRSC